MIKEDFITRLLKQKREEFGLVQEIEKAMFKIISLGQYTPRKSPVVREERNQLSKDIYSYLIYGKKEIGDGLLKKLASKIRDKKQAWDLLTVPPNGRTRQDTKKVEAQEGAEILAKELGIPFSACLEREEITIRCTQDLKGKSVLLYDDMVRTGATLRKAIKALLEKGAVSIQPCVLARGMTLESPHVSVKKGPVQNFIEKLVKKMRQSPHWKMELRDINPDSLKDVNNQELLNLHRRTHQLWGRTTNLTKEELMHAHLFLVKEMLQRGMNHNIVDDLDKETEKWMSKGYIDAEEYYLSQSKYDGNFIADMSLVIKELDSSVTSVLEVGCGAGRGLEVLSNSGFNVKGLDITDSSIKICRDKGFDVDKGDVNRLLYKDESFDAVVSMHVMEHIKDFDKGVAECIRVSKNKSIHIIPLGERLDSTHEHKFMKIEDLKERFHALGYNAKFGLNKFNDAVVVIYKKSSIPPIFVDYKDVVLVKDFCNLVGGIVKKTDNYGDIDVLFREDPRNEYAEIAVRNLFKYKFRKELHWIYNPSGPHDDYIPIGDLVIRMKDDFMGLNSIVKRALKPITRFTPLKMATGYTQQEYFDREQLYDNWAKKYLSEGIKLSVQMKYWGWRTIMEKADKETLVYFEDSQKDRSHQFPDIIDDLKKIGDDIILDSDFEAYSPKTNDPIPRKDLAYWGKENIVINEVFENPSGVKGRLSVHVFDILYWKEDLHTLPYEERRKKLEELFKQYKFKILKIAPEVIVSTKSELISAIEKASKIKGSEGAVIKTLTGDYPLTGQTPTWAKIKNALEIKVKVTGKNKVAGSEKTYNYNIAILVNGKLTEIGKTFNTNVNADIGDIITIVVQEVVPEKTEQGWKTTFVVPKVSDIALDRKEPDASHEIIQRADKARILQATDVVREELRKENLVKALPEGEEEGRRNDFDVKEGDAGVYVVQEHEMGLTEESAKSKTPRENLRDTGNVHNDIRMRVKGKDYLVGFTATIGNLKMRNKLLTIKEGEKVLVPAFKLKQPLVWVDIGKTTYHIFEPGEVGAREKSWARMKRVDYGKFEIGTVDEHYIEIRFDGSKMKGRYILQYVPVEDGRKWMISKPQEQTMDRERGGKRQLPHRLKGGNNKMDWNELLGPFFDNEQERKEFVEKAEKQLVGQDLEKLKGALELLAGIKELPEEAKKAIAVLAKLAGYGYPKEYPVKKVEELEKTAFEMKSSIEKLTQKIEALEKKAPEKKVDVFGQTVTEGKKKE